ncbi:MAG: methyl-accepting chemotaxis protein [Rhodoferax sp.]
MNFSTMKVYARLSLAFGVVIAVIVLTSLFSIGKLASIEESLEDVVLDNNVKIAHVNDLSESSHIVARVMRSIILVPPEAKKAELEKLQKAREHYTQAWDKLQLMPADEQGKVLRVKIDNAYRQSKELNNKVIELGLAGKVEEATKELMTVANPAAQQLQDAIDENLDLQERSNRSQFEKAQADYRTARTALIAACVLAVLLAAGMAFVVTRSITRQLGAEPNDAIDVAQRVSRGDLAMPITLQSGDQSSLMAQLKTMQESLVRVVANVRQGSEGVATASAEIASGNNDLSARTEQQASALEETAASMEELASTVKQNADNARQANQLAMNASTVAVKGGEVVGQVVETMKGINDSSRKIADIISVIDGIAFQTNILALNAAVEAARAGEQGRGFAVVASEVRSLAGRSAEAAKEIKTLISASVERVEFGTNLVDQAGSTMTEVVTSIKRVTDIMGEISSASVEQSAGVSQVGEAVSQMDQVTQQNAALVEEMAAAATSLKSQASDLVNTVAVFKLSLDDHHMPRAQVRAGDSSAFKGEERRGVSHKAAPARPAPAKAAPPVVNTPVHLPKPAAAKAKSATSDDDWETF